MAYNYYNGSGKKTGYSGSDVRENKCIFEMGGRKKGYRAKR